jgi:hypothetical protein
MSPSDQLAPLVEFMRNAPDAIARAKGIALANVITMAEAEAKRNSKDPAIWNTRGRYGRTLTGGLLNAIYSGFEKNGENISGYVGVRGIPYGRIHEYGGEIKPVNAQHLWVPNYRKAGKMTPREFVQLMKAQPDRYAIFGHKNQVAARWTGAYQFIGRKKTKTYDILFNLLNKVTIPERPYVTPAIEKAYESIAPTFAQILARELSK